MKNGKRELLIGAVGLVKGSVREDGKVMVATCDQLELEFESTKFLEDASFDVVSLIIRYGTTWGDEPEIGKINRHRELEVAIELPMSELRGMNFDTLSETVMNATLRSLVAVGRKYNLPVKRWDNLLAADVSGT